MTLVEDAAAYLDGAGREEAKALPRAEALAYAAESMRLTTRLMQIASWLLLQRAVNQGEMTRWPGGQRQAPGQAVASGIRFQPRRFSGASPQAAGTVNSSVRMQTRVVRLDMLIYAPAASAPSPLKTSPVEEQLELLRNAFAGHS